MTYIEKKDFSIYPVNYLDAIIEGNPFYIQFKKFEPEIEAQTIKIIHRYLEQYDLLFHKNTIISIIKELISNAVKANLKRIYFESSELDIDNPAHYRKGMETFKEYVFQSQKSKILSLLNESKYAVKVTFSASNDIIQINVKNNIAILEPELKKIKSRVSKAYRYNNIAEAFEDVLDDSEGAGLGLIMALMLLKNSGFPRDSFSIEQHETGTLASLNIPYNKTSPESHFKITEEIVKEIDKIPSLPDNVKRIGLLCKNPESTIKDISHAISIDPGLTASIIKLSNSAGYITMNRIETIDEAVKIIGIEGINTLLIATGVQKIVEAKYKKFEAIWNDSHKRAFYAQQIIKKTGKNSRQADQVYLAALLADIGRIVMLSLQDDLFKKLKEISGYKGIEDSSLLEEIALGISHSSLGAMICKKWNFNESLTKTIELHHRPHLAPENLKALIYTVYLADLFVDIEKNRSRFEIADEDVLKFFNLDLKEEFIIYHNSISKKFFSKIETP